MPLAFPVVLALEPEAVVAPAERGLVIAALIALRAPIAVVDADAVVVVVEVQLQILQPI